MSALLSGLLRTGFWAAALSIAASYVALPALILLRGRLVRRPVRSADIEPTVTVVLAAYNEEASIGTKLENLLATDYPPGRRQIVVASDGSTDRTNEIVRAFADRGVELLALARVGKADALNAAIARATGEILVFTDANTIFAPDALRALVRPFADPEVGGVAGDQRYRRGGEGGIASGERSYWDLDRALKVAESSAGNVVSATGAIYAARRELVPPVAVGVTDDFITSTAVVLRGRRLVFAEDAVAYEPVAASGGIEFGRKVRIITRGLRGVVLHRALLDPRRTGFYAVQLFWHKLLRRLVAVPMVVLAVTSPLLWGDGILYRLATLGQVVGYGLGAAGLLLRDRPIGRRRWLALPAYLVMVNAAALMAALNVVRGRRIDRWEPQRGVHATSLEPAPGRDVEEAAA